MKRIVSVLLTVCLFGGLFAVTGAALDVSPQFSEHFFPDGKPGVPTDIYYDLRTNENGKVNLVDMWYTQSEEILAIQKAYDESESLEDCAKQYGAYPAVWDIQVDYKLDDGKWGYTPSWDQGDLYAEDEPYFLLALRAADASAYERTHRMNIMDAYYCEEGGEGAGYLAPLWVYDADRGNYFDFDNHSLTLRARYLVRYDNDNLSEEERDANGGSYSSYITSDWSEEITIGKNSTQEELAKPEKIDAPVLSNLTFVKSDYEEEGRITSEWTVDVEYPKSVGLADKYYTIKEDAFEPFLVIIEYRVQKDGVWGDWSESYWGNPTWLWDGKESFPTEDTDQDDIIEFRTYIRNNVEEGKDSAYSNSVFCGVPIQAPKAIRGDCNGDTLVNMKDVLYLRRYLAGTTAAFPAHDCNGVDRSFVRGDCNNDEAVNMKDVLLLRKLLAGLVDSLDPCVCEQEVAAFAVKVTGGQANVETAAPGATVSLTADLPEEGFEFVSWYCNDDTVAFEDANSEITSFVMPAGAVEIRGVFRPIVYTLTVNDGEGERITAPAPGEIVSVTIAEPQPGYVFDGWVIDGVEVDDVYARTLSFEMPSNNVSLMANFVEQ